MIVRAEIYAIAVRFKLTALDFIGSSNCFESHPFVSNSVVRSLGGKICSEKY